MIWKKMLVVVLTISLILTLTACAHKPDNNTPANNGKTIPAPLNPDKKYIIKQGLEFYAPENWTDRVEIKEEKNKMVADYIKIPNKRINIFTVNIWTHKDYEDIKKQEGEAFATDSVIGQNSSYVFYLITPIDMDLTQKEYEKYGDDFQSVQIPFPNLLKRFTVIKQ